MSYLVVSYYTKGSVYEEHSKTLCASLKKWGVRHYVEGIDSLGSWLLNTGYKPTFLLRMLDSFSDDIVWVDCDAEFLAYPSLFDSLTCNVAVHKFDVYLGKRFLRSEILSGTVWLRNCEETKEIVRQWEKECAKHTERWDQKSLQAVIGDNFHALPFSYCKICDRGDAIENPVIVHYQASRDYRKEERMRKRFGRRMYK